jgi:hypothetical protein
MNANWSALSNPTFRRLWIASVISGTCVAAHHNAATSLMNTFAASPFLISVMSTVALRNSLRRLLTKESRERLRFLVGPIAQLRVDFEGAPDPRRNGIQRYAKRASRR